MSELKKFKPNLIPNNPKDGSFDIEKALNKNGGCENYIALLKKDGARLEVIDEKLLSRSLKEPSSDLVKDKFEGLVALCHDLKIVLEGEFYAHGFKFNTIMRFFSKSDVTTTKYRQELEKEFSKNPNKFAKDYDSHSIEFLTQFHDELKFWLFDGYVLDRPDLVGYAERMEEIISRLSSSTENLALNHIVFPEFMYFNNTENLNELFQLSLSEGYEGLVLVHKDHKYKFGRNSLNEGTLLKIKNDDLEYDGVVIDVVEATSVKDGVEKTTNELGRSVTSKKKDDREASGIAKGLVTSFINDKGEDLGTFTVSLKGFDNEQRKEMFINKDQFIGNHFKYKAMTPVKDFPRHAFFDCWRDEK